MKFFMVRDDDSEKAEALLAASGIRAKTFDSGYGCFAHEEAGYRARGGAGPTGRVAEGTEDACALELEKMLNRDSERVIDGDMMDGLLQEAADRASAGAAPRPGKEQA